MEAQSAIEGIAGDWCGERNVSYVVDEVKWNVSRNLAGFIYHEEASTRPYSLDWDEEYGMILWGTTYFFDPRDLDNDMFTIAWYRNGDPDKRTKMFTWHRPPGFDLESYLQEKKQGKKKERLPQTPEEIRRREENAKKKEEASKKKEDIAKKKMEEERQKYFEDLAAKRKASEEARKKSEEKARKEVERRAELAEEAKRKEEEELLMRVEAQRKKQEDLAKKRSAEEQRMRQEMQHRKQQKIAALSAAAARAASAVRKKKAGNADDGKKSMERERSAAQVATPRVAAEDSAAAAVEELHASNRTEVREPDPRPNLIVALLGDALSRRRLFANLLFVTGAWDRQRLERFQQEQCNATAVASDANASEKNSGSAASGNSKIRCAHINTAARRFVLLDAPGPEEDMRTAMACAAQAHAAVLLVSAVAELQDAIEPGRGPLWQRAAVLHGMGISRIIVVIECMEDPRVNWRRERFEEVQKRVSLLLSALGVAAGAAVFVPVSNILRSFFRERSSDGAWFKGPTLLEQFGALPMPALDCRGSTLFLPLETSSDQGNVQVLGSVIRGTLRAGTRCVVVPSQQECTVKALISEQGELMYAEAGEVLNLKFTLPTTANIGQHEALYSSSAAEPIRCVTKLRVALQILKPAASCRAIGTGFIAILCAHGAEEECTLLKLTEGIHLETGEALESPQAASPDTLVIAVLQVHRPLALAIFSKCRALGRFLLRAPEADTIIALGRVIELPKDPSSRLQ